jgi:hypothetical protein
MTTQRAAYEVLVEQLTAEGIDVAAVKDALKHQHIETPSWGYANSGTRFKAFAWPGAATHDPREARRRGHGAQDDRHRAQRWLSIFPGTSRRTAITPRCASTPRRRASASARSTPTFSRMTSTSSVRFGNPDPGVQERALDHVLECCAIMGKVNSDMLSLWFADGTNYAGQDGLRHAQAPLRASPGHGLRPVARRQPHVDRVQVLRADLLQHRHPRLGHGLCLGAEAGRRRRRCWSIWATTRRASTSNRSWPSCSTRASWAASTSTTANTPTTI